MNEKFIKLEESLKFLKENCPSVQVKAEFESEGSFLHDVASLTSLCKKLDILINIKLSGFEALRDVYELSYLGVDGVIVPMVESKFGVYKFRKTIENLGNIHNFSKVSVLVESVNGLNNLEEIVLEFGNTINSLIIGRGDLSASFKNSSSRDFLVDDPEFMGLIADSLKKIRHLGNFKIGIGGKLSLKTLSFLNDSENFQDLVDFLETRKIILPLKELLQNNNLLQMAIDVEKKYINHKLNFYNTVLKQEISRLLLLESRLNTQE